ncbi:hypothetical protein T01_5348 [Trichinella spiralis]|uniref:Uncharacterized protein n=1 Tax=Trichinella spiralis TaxID=6334 RepID=A0A0V0YUH2_TRISP|nr:hypothetical protein T01_5348 [Trichinella spiralis]
MIVFWKDETYSRFYGHRNPYSRTFFNLFETDRK